MRFQLDRYWAGTEQSLQEYLLTATKFSAQGLTLPSMEVRPEVEESRLLTRVGSVGIIEVKGYLVNDDDSLWNELTGRTGYGEIRQAAIEAALDPDISAVLLNIHSGGGQVSGVKGAADLLVRFDQSVKPVFTYAEDLMASAAYRLGASARALYVGDEASIGSIGVLAVHQEYSKMMEKEGITVEIIRSGPFKALGHPMEPLSELGRTTIKNEVEFFSEKFTREMAARRGVSYEVFDKTAGQGRIFYGEQAVKVNLVDGVGTFEEVLSSIESAVKKK